jgi:hypothetical protein
LSCSIVEYDDAHQRGGRGAKFGKLKFDARRAVACKGRKTGIFTPKSGHFGRCGKEIFLLRVAVQFFYFKYNRQSAHAAL